MTDPLIIVIKIESLDGICLYAICLDTYHTRYHLGYIKEKYVIHQLKVIKMDYSFQIQSFYWINRKLLIPQNK